MLTLTPKVKRREEKSMLAGAEYTISTQKDTWPLGYLIVGPEND